MVITNAIGTNDPDIIREYMVPFCKLWRKVTDTHHSGENPPRALDFTIDKDGMPPLPVLTIDDDDKQKQFNVIH